MPVASEVDFAVLIRSMERITGANIENVCKKSAMLAIKRYVSHYKNIIPENIEDLRIEPDDFLLAIRTLGC
jgi:SpoVK/Ycf46/Vps4 family AAA+-type ATPase